MKTLKNLILVISIAFSPTISSAGVFLEPLRGSNQLFRGRAPTVTEAAQLPQAGITSVLIFKNQTKTEVDEEIQQLRAAGIDPRKIYHIPFQWKDIASEELACEQVVEALQILTWVMTQPQDRILFHCTIGEDRTGLLAGLMAQLMAPVSTEDAYLNDMCRKGFSGGNLTKPVFVQQKVDQYLTPLFFKMSSLIRTRQLRLDNLNKNICRQIVQLPNDTKLCREVMAR